MTFAEGVREVLLQEGEPAAAGKQVLEFYRFGGEAGSGSRRQICQNECD
ncbi:MAG: hypothetical protein LPD71_06630 [Shewanella sp.]|nr:hypothetical protein [Shewanella sp.]MCF1456139.1 hypothetical protein [Shewanella sp.]